MSSRIHLNMGSKTFHHSESVKVTVVVSHRVAQYELAGLIFFVDFLLSCCGYFSIAKVEH